MDVRVLNAICFATCAHNGRVRKYTGEPEITHPLNVVARLVEHGLTDPVLLQAAVLHDVLEDTPTTVEKLQEFFDPEVVAVVQEVTDKSKPEDGNRAVRKEIDRISLVGCSVHAAHIKLADILSNADGIELFSGAFGLVWFREKYDLLDYLRHGNREIFNEACSRIDQFYNSAHLRPSV